MVDALFQRCCLSCFTFDRYPRLVKSIRSSFIKLLILFCLAIYLNLLAIVPAEASTCRQLARHNVCIIKLKRSAKYYWEYRAVISVDGKKKPLEIYNCRDRLKTNRDKDVVPFSQDGIGELVCSLYAK